MTPGFDIRFNPEDGDPASTDVEYIDGADTSLDMLEGARALLHRAANFVNADDGFEVEANACWLAYDIATGAADCMAADDAVSLDEDFVCYTERQHGLLHVMRLLRDNPLPDWQGPA